MAHRLRRSFENDKHKTFVGPKTFVQRRPNVFDVDLTLYKCFAFTGIEQTLVESLVLLG